MKKILTIFSILFVFVGANVNATDIVPYGSGYTTSEVYYKTNQYPIKIMGYETGATFQGKILAEVTVVHNDERTWSIGNIIHYRTDVNGVKVDSPTGATQCLEKTAEAPARGLSPTISEIRATESLLR